MSENLNRIFTLNAADPEKVSPVFISGGYLYKDDSSDSIKACLQICNHSGKELKTLSIRLYPFDKDGKQIPKGYYWYELEDDGVTIKTDDEGYYLPEKRSADEKDIPAANKANGEESNNGYRVVNNPTEAAYYNDYEADITFNSSKIDGKVITKDTNFISDVGYGRNEKGEIATTTRFVLDGKSYKAVKDSDTQKWMLVAVE